MEDDNDILAVIKQINRLRKKAKFKRAKKKLIEELLLEEKYKEEDFYSEVLYEAYLRNKDEIERELMQKYFDFDLNQMEELNRQAQEQVQNEEIKQKLEELGITDEKEQQEIAEKFKEEQQNDQSQDKNSDKSLNEKIIYAAAYKRTKDFGEQVEKQKEEQIKDKRLALTPDEGAKDIADAKVLEKLDKKYKETTGKELSKNTKIKALEDDFEHRKDYLEAAVLSGFLYENRQRQDKEYLATLAERRSQRAIVDKDVKIDAYQKDKEQQEYNIVKRDKSQKDYIEDLETQKDLEKKTKDAGIEKYSVVSEKANISGNKESRNISDSKQVEEFKSQVTKNEDEKLKTDEQVDINAKKLEEKGDYETLSKLEEERKQNAEVHANIGRENIDGKQYKSNISDTANTIHENKEENLESRMNMQDEFRAELMKNVASEDEKIENEVNSNNTKRAIDDLNKEKYQKAQEDKYESERVLRQNRKTNKPGNNF